MQLIQYIALLLVHLLALSMAIPVAQDTADTAKSAGLGKCWVYEYTNFLGQKASLPAYPQFQCTNLPLEWQNRISSILPEPGLRCVFNTFWCGEIQSNQKLYLFPGANVWLDHDNLYKSYACYPQPKKAG